MKRGDTVRLKKSYVVMSVEDVRTDEDNGNVYVDVEWLDSQAHLQSHSFFIEQLELYND